MQNRILQLLVGAIATTCALNAAAFLPNTFYTVTRQANLHPVGSVNVQGNPASGVSGTYSSGLFGLKADGVDFLTVCADGKETLFSTSQIYYTQMLSSYNSPISADGHILDATDKSNLQKLFTVAWSAADDNSTKSAAFQWAVWEIERETNPQFNLNNGAVKNNNNAVRQQANAFLSQINAQTFETDLMIWIPVKQVTGGFQRVAGQELLTVAPVAPVPEPATMLPVVVAAGLGWVLRRRRSQAA